MAIKFNRSQTFATNGTVTAAGLHNLIDGTDIYQALITDQPSLTAVAPEDSILIADASLTAGDAPRQTTVSNLFDDALTGGTYTNINLTGALTFGTATGNRTVSTSATITTGTIPNLTAGTTTSTVATIPTLTAGTTTSTAANITNGTIQTLTSSTATITGGTFSGSVNSTSGTIGTLNATTGTISNLSTTLAGDFTISQGTGTIGTGTITAAKLANPQYTGFRNRIINGDMRIDQRNAGAAVTVNTGSPSYTLDRWYAYQNSPSTGVQISRSTSAPSGFQNSIKWGRNGSGTAGGVTALGQVLETANSLDLQGGYVTLSFYARAGANFSSSSSQLGVNVISGTGTDQSALSMVTVAWTNYAQVINTGVTLTTSWQKFTLTSPILGSSVSQLGVDFRWTTVGAAGADDNVYITGVQLEAGSTATEFERRPIGTELALCQRYYWKTFDQSVAPANGSNDYRGTIGFNHVNGNIGQGTCYFPCTMRAVPTVTFYNPRTSGSSGQVTDTVNDDSATRAAGLSDRSFIVDNTSTNNTNDSRVYVHAAVSAEL